MHYSQEITTQVPRLATVIFVESPAINCRMANKITIIILRIDVQAAGMHLYRPVLTPSSEADTKDGHDLRPDAVHVVHRGQLGHEKRSRYDADPKPDLKNELLVEEKTAIVSPAAVVFREPPRAGTETTVSAQEQTRHENNRHKFGEIPRGPFSGKDHQSRSCLNVWVHPCPLRP